MRLLLNLLTCTATCACAGRSAVGGGRPGAGPLQTQAAASQIADAGEVGEDAAGGAGARQAAGGGERGAAGAGVLTGLSPPVCVHGACLCRSDAFRFDATHRFVRKEKNVLGWMYTLINILFVTTILQV